MFNVKVKRGSSLSKKLKHLKTIHNQSVAIGHFEDQGKHYSGLSYVDLMKFHHDGDGQTVPRRPVITILENFRTRKALNSATTNSLLNKFVGGELSAQQVLTGIGKQVAKEEKKIFGDKGSLAGNTPNTIAVKGADSPLVDTGDLRDAVSYRTSITKTIERG